MHDEGRPAPLPVSPAPFCAEARAEALSVCSGVREGEAESAERQAFVPESAAVLAEAD